jgi:predicted Zn-dependent protease
VQLVDLLHQFECRRDELQIALWHLSLAERCSISLGMRAMEVGSVYDPPKSSTQISGRLYVQWADGLVSKTDVNAAFLRRGLSGLAAIREVAYEESYPIELPEPAGLTAVQVWDGEVAAMVRSNPAPLFSLMGTVKQALTEQPTTNISAKVVASEMSQRLYNSRGLAVTFPKTQVSYSMNVDATYSVSCEQRNWFDEARVHDQLVHLQQMLGHFRNRQTFAHQPTTVILMPAVARRFVSHYLLANLSAERIFDGRSVFSLQDFAARVPFIHPTLHLIHDPCQPWKSGSYPMDAQGIPARVVPLIVNGRLVHPCVSLKGAKQTGLPPTPRATETSTVFQSSCPQNLWDYLGTVQTGYMVGQVLGMRTQDATSGHYSLSAPHGLVIQDGRVIGATHGLLSGNFFAHLREEVMLLHSPYHEAPGLAFEGKIIL